jgi:phosphoribosylformimino-5-aminoimidazole carboxamide ribotide isomerase
MKIYPAIDILKGKCVRLIQGDYDKETVFSESPIDIAKRWKNEGAKDLHIVDLDGAKDGSPHNLTIISKICKELNINIQVGGGFRNFENIDKAIESGIDRVILGTSAINKFELLKKALKKYREKIIVGIDARNGMVATEGWTKTSSVQALELGKRLGDIGLENIIYTDISRDGMMQGPNFQEIEKMVSNLSINIIASGGITNIEDLVELKSLNVSGAIIGKALYTGAIKLEDAFNIL